MSAKLFRAGEPEPDNYAHINRDGKYAACGKVLVGTGTRTSKYSIQGLELCDQCLDAQIKRTKKEAKHVG